MAIVGSHQLVDNAVVIRLVDRRSESSTRSETTAKFTMSCDAHGGTTSKMRPEENDDNRATTWPGAALGAGGSRRSATDYQ